VQRAGKSRAALSASSRSAADFLRRTASRPHAPAAHAARRTIVRRPADTAFGVTPTERLAVGPQPVRNPVPIAPMARVVDDNLPHGDVSCLRSKPSLKYRAPGRILTGTGGVMRSRWDVLPTNVRHAPR